MADELRLALAAELRLLQAGEPSGLRGSAHGGDNRQQTQQQQPLLHAASSAAAGDDENAQSLAKTVQVSLRHRSII